MHDTYQLLIAASDTVLRERHAAQLDADGHEIHEADRAAAAVAKLAAHAIDVLILSDLDRPADAPRLLRDLRAGELHPKVHRAQLVITLGANDEPSVLRAYDAGSDHHLPADSGYLVLRAAITAVTRRAYHDNPHDRHIHVGELHIDTAARTVDVAGTPVHVSRTEYDLLLKFASDPTRVFSKAELARAGGRRDMPARTIDSHVWRLRGRCADAGADVIHNRWGIGWALITPDQANT